MPDDLTSALDQIRADIGARDELVARMQLGRSYPVAEFNAAQDQLAERVPLLLAAVDEVLKLADSAKVKGTTVCGCQDCTTARGNGFTGIHRLQPYMWDLDPAKVREAITAALTGDKPAR